MILTDAGPLVAIIDAREPAHDRCVSALETLKLPMVSTWPVFTEAMYLLGDAAGWPAQELLWRIFRRDDLVLVELTVPLAARAQKLMATYKDVPMDLADASLVAVAEPQRWDRIFTLDSHFHAYRSAKRRPFVVIPS
jgi:predicted nucleic acid-binding protein